MAQLPNFTSKVFLAPMAGVSDPALRIMCKKMGAGLVVTELTSVNAIVAKHEQLESQSKNITEFIEFSEKERPLSVQLFGSDITALEKAAKIVEPHFDMIDYNMGLSCPTYYKTNGRWCIITKCRSYKTNIPHTCQHSQKTNFIKNENWRN